MYLSRFVLAVLSTVLMVFLPAFSQAEPTVSQEVYAAVYSSSTQSVSTISRRPYLIAPLGKSKDDFDWSTLNVFWDGKLSTVKPVFGPQSVGLTPPIALGNGYHTAMLKVKDSIGNYKIFTWRILIATPGIKDPGRALWVEVNQKLQRVYVLKGSRVVKEIICSTGKPRTPTPNGIFKILNRGKWFVTKEKTAGAKHWVSFKGFGRYMFHSVIYNPKGTAIIKREAAKLGQKASHGCIRLPLDDAKWFYDNVPEGSRVVIHEPK